LGLDSSIPIGVQQHTMLIAVNYAARPFGVKRGDSADDAKRKCPSIVCAQVEVLNNKPNLNRYRESSVRIMKILNSFKLATCERASIDEAYLDVSDWVNCV
jgi:DNA polymerase eta